MSQCRWQNELRSSGNAYRATCAIFAAESGRSNKSSRWRSQRSACSSLFRAFSRSIASLIRQSWLRSCVAVAALVGCCTIPWFLHRWVWRFRRLRSTSPTAQPKDAANR